MSQVTVGLPVKVAGVAGTLAIVKVLASELQYAVFAFTETYPEVKAASLIAALMLAVVEVPVNPVGSVHV